MAARGGAKDPLSLSLFGLCALASEIVLTLRVVQGRPIEAELATFGMNVGEVADELERAANDAAEVGHEAIDAQVSLDLLREAGDTLTARVDHARGTWLRAVTLRQHDGTGSDPERLRRVRKVLGTHLPRLGAAVRSLNELYRLLAASDAEDAWWAQITADVTALRAEAEDLAHRIGEAEIRVSRTAQEPHRLALRARIARVRRRWKLLIRVTTEFIGPLPPDTYPDDYAWLAVLKKAREGRPPRRRRKDEG